MSKKASPGIVWFKIPADDMARAKTFYSKLFGWKINPMPYMEEYFHMDTGGPDASPDGGILKRMHPAHTITSYVRPSVAKFAAKI
jgi:predicted enzyme related to lactoylglutathione lyase